MPAPRDNTPVGKLQASPEGIQDSLERQVKMEAMLAHKAMGKSVREIAALFKMPSSTVQHWLTKARQQEQLQRAKGIVGDRLVPKAIAVYDQRLEAGDLEAARDILYGAGVLVKGGKLTVETAADPLEAFRQKYFERTETIDAQEVLEVPEE